MPGPKSKYNGNGEFETLYNLGYSDRKISIITGCNSSLVWQWRHKHNLPSYCLPPQKRPPTDLSRHFPYKTYLDGLKSLVKDLGYLDPKEAQYALLVAEKATHDDSVRGWLNGR